MKKFCLLTLVLMGLFVTSCESDDPPLPDNTLNFTATEIGFDDTETTKSIAINLDRTETTDVTVTIGVTTSGVEYGAEADFTTTPAVTDNTITATIKAGTTSATIDVKKVAQFFDGNESIDFEIKSANGSVVLGTKKTLKLTFGAIVSSGASMTLQGGEGTSSAVNSVFVDFSGNEQTVVARNSWSLGFYCGDEFAVKINNTTGSSAKQYDIALTDIISTDAAAVYSDELTFGRLNEGGSFDVIDPIDGNLSNNVIKANNTYIVQLGSSATGESKLYKVKVIQTANGYSLQYAASESASVKTVEITKDANYNFIYYSFGSASIVNVEPEKAKWDIRWSYQTYTAGTIPYNFADFVVINYLEGVAAAQILTSTISYADFKVSDIESVEFSSDVNIIGSSWRAGGGPSTAPAVRTDRFYVIKDSSGNIYKLRFTSLGAVRGYPEIEYALVK